MMRATAPPHLLAAVVVASLLAFFDVASAQDVGMPGSAPLPEGPIDRDPGEVSNVVEQLSQQIYSPYCPGKTLAMCPSGGAAGVRRSIQKMARRGMTKKQIKQEILERHGEEYRFEEPPAEDNYPLLGLIIAALLACGGAVWFFSRESSSDDGDDPSDPDDDWSEEDEVYLEEIRRDYQQ